MKHLHVMIDDDTFIKLKSITSYRGELSNIVRLVIQDFVNKADSIKTTCKKVDEIKNTL